MSGEFEPCSKDGNDTKARCSPRGPSTNTSRLDARHFRGKSYQEGVDALTPPENIQSKSKKRPTVDLGDGPELAAISDVPRGDTARLDVELAKLEPRSGIAALVGKWPQAIGHQTSVYKSHRDGAAESLIQHQLHASTRSAPGRSEHARREAALTTHYGRYGTLAALGQELSIATGASVPLCAQADHQFLELMAMLGASGHAEKTEKSGGRHVVDGKRLSAEQTHYRDAAERRGSTEHVAEHTAIEALGGAHGHLLAQLGRATSASHKLHAKLHRDAARRDQTELGRREGVFAILKDLEGFFGTVATFVSVPGADLVKGLDFVSGDSTMAGRVSNVAKGAKSGTGALAKLLDAVAGGELERLRSTIASRVKLGDIDEGLARQSGIDAELRELDRQLREFASAITRAQDNGTNHQARMGIVAQALDQDARDQGRLADGAERFVPIAQRLARIQVARAWNAQARAILTNLMPRFQEGAALTEQIHRWVGRDADLNIMRRSLDLGLWPMLGVSVSDLLGILAKRELELGRMGAMP